MIYLYVTLMLSIASITSAENTVTSRIRVFPAMNQSIGGVFQVSKLNQRHQPEYAFNASEARTVCSSLNVTIASKAEVVKAHASGLETCRFGWVDENLAVIPRIKPLSNCGSNQTGVITWRTPVTQVFDVFCFNESDVVTHLNHSATVIPLSSRGQSASHAPLSTQTTRSASSLHPLSSSPPETISEKAESALSVSTAQGSARAKMILITSACALLLTAIIIVVYLKLADVKQQQEYVETREWTCVKGTDETKKDAQEDEKIAVEDDAS